MAKPKHSPPHAQAGSKTAQKPEQKNIRKRNGARDQPKLPYAAGRGTHGGQAIVTHDLPDMGQSCACGDQQGRKSTAAQLCLHGAAAAKGRGTQNFVHAALALHGKKPAEAQGAQQPGKKRILHIAAAGKTKQLFITAFIHRPCAGMRRQIVANVGKNIGVYIVFLLQRRVSKRGIAADFALLNPALHLQQRGEFFTLMQKPSAAFLIPRGRNRLHVIGVINFVGIDIAFGVYALIDAEYQKGCQKQCSAVGCKKLASFFTRHGNGAGFPGKAPGKAALWRGRQLPAAKQNQKTGGKRGPQNKRRRPFNQGQRDGAAEPI